MPRADGPPGPVPPPRRTPTHARPPRNGRSPVRPAPPAPGRSEERPLRPRASPAHRNPPPTDDKCRSPAGGRGQACVRRPDGRRSLHPLRATAPGGCNRGRPHVASRRSPASIHSRRPAHSPIARWSCSPSAGRRCRDDRGTDAGTGPPSAALNRGHWQRAGLSPGLAPIWVVRWSARQCREPPAGQSACCSPGGADQALRAWSRP